MLAVREFKTGAEVLDNVKRTNAYFDALRPATKSPWQTRFEQLLIEYEAIKGERDQYRAISEKLTDENTAYKQALTQAETNNTVPTDGPITTEKIIRLVAKHYGVGRDHIMSLCRQGNLPVARHVAMYIARQLTGQTYPQLGRIFARDHSSVIHAIKKVERSMTSDQQFANEVATLTAAIVGVDSNLGMTPG